MFVQHSSPAGQIEACSPFHPNYDEIVVIYIDISAKPACFCCLQNGIQVPGWFNQLAAYRQLDRRHVDHTAVGGRHHLIRHQEKITQI